jgi:carboxylesterase type B
MPGGGRGADTPANTKLPTIVWLHGYSYQLGYICRISRRIT